MELGTLCMPRECLAPELHFQHLSFSFRRLDLFLSALYRLSNFVAYSMVALYPVKLLQRVPLFQGLSLLRSFPFLSSPLFSNPCLKEKILTAKVLPRASFYNLRLTVFLSARSPRRSAVPSTGHQRNCVSTASFESSATNWILERKPG